MRRRKSNFNLKLLSVVVPAYKQEKTIIKDIKNIVKALEAIEYKYEVIVVVDGNLDNTFKKASTLKSSKIKILGYEINQGKGHAVRFGMMQAKGDVIGFIDAGMDIHPTGFKMLLNHMEWYNADVIVGSKLHPVSKVKYPIHRKILSWGYRILTATLFGFKISDTQVGLKFFKKKVVKKVLPRLLVKRFAFDVEFFAVAYRYGFTRIFEAPIKINYRGNTILSTNIWKVAYYMLWDTMAVFYRVHIRHYYDTKKSKRKYFSKSMKTTIAIRK